MLRFIKQTLMLMLVAGLTIVMGCGEDGDFEPSIFLFKAEPNIVGKGEEVKISLSAGDVDKELLTYIWSKDGGTFIEPGEYGATWIAPEEEGVYNITVKVSDGIHEIAETVKILVWRSGDYYPLVVDNKWVYIDQDGNEITFEIIDTIAIQGTDVKESFVIEKRVPNSESEPPENVNYSYVGRSKDGFGIDQHAVSVGTNSPDTMMFVPWLPLYKFPLKPGDSWEVEYTAKLPPEGYFIGDGTAKYEVIAEETVTVLAGTFEGVFRVRETFTWQFEELGEDKLDETVADKWLAPNVGIIKIEQVQERVGETLKSELELKIFEVKLK